MRVCASSHYLGIYIDSTYRAPCIKLFLSDTSEFRRDSAQEALTGSDDFGALKMRLPVGCWSKRVTTKRQTIPAYLQVFVVSTNHNLPLCSSFNSPMQ